MRYKNVCATSAWEQTLEIRLRPEHHFLSGGGRAALTIAEHDWQNSNIGPIEAWPVALKITLSLMLQSHFPKAIVWGQDLITFHNDAFEPILGAKPNAIGRSFKDVWAEAWPDLSPIVEKVFAGEASFFKNFPIKTNRRGFEEQAYFTFCYSPIRDETGAVAGFMDTVIETTETVIAERRLSVVNGELAHRMRNILAMVTSIASLTLRHATSVEEGKEKLLARFAALSQVQSFLISDTRTEVTIPVLIEQVMAPHAEARQRMTISGPDLVVSGQSAFSLALILNELVTNSLKHGAWSNSDGWVEVVWTIADAEFRLTWQDRGISQSVGEAREGFGTKVLMRFVPSSLGGDARITRGDDSFRYEITAPAATVLR